MTETSTARTAAPVASDPAADLLTVAEFAAQLRVSAPTIRNWIAQGTLVSIQAGRAHRIPRSELDRLLRPASRGSRR